LVATDLRGCSPYGIGTGPMSFGTL